MIDEEEVLDFLEHYGVRGMHWGIRNKKPKTKIFKKNISRPKMKALIRKGKEKVLYNLDVNGRRSKDVGPASIQKRIVMGVGAAAFIASGVYQVNKVLKETGHIHL